MDETNLTAVYPPDDGRPGVSCAQWMKYQLDNFATVEEVLTHLGDLRPDGEGWHYLIANATGECAVIEYLDGEPLVCTGEDIEVCALANTTYRQALSHIPLDVAFGGEIDIEAGGPYDVSGLLADYFLEANQSIPYWMRDSSDASAGIALELKTRGLTFQQALDLIAQHPTTGANNLSEKSKRPCQP